MMSYGIELVIGYWTSPGDEVQQNHFSIRVSEPPPTAN